MGMDPKAGGLIHAKSSTRRGNGQETSLEAMVKVYGDKSNFENTDYEKLFGDI